MKLLLLLLFWLPALAEAAGTAAASSEETLISIRSFDERVATVGHRLAVAGLDLCQDQAWLPGFALHDLSQYAAGDRPAVSRAFGLDAGPGVLALADSGPAARAGLRSNDIVLRLDGVALPGGNLSSGPSFDRMEQILTMLDDALADGAVQIGVRRDGTAMTIALQAERGCATRFQLIPSRRLNAAADGRYVQLTSAIADYVTDDQELAAVIAHELAHNVLRHRARLDAAGISRGFLGNFGRNARLIRETEAEADRLSIYLLDRAGYDPEAAVRFWERFGRRGLNFIGSPTHGNWRTRVAMLRAEIENVRRARVAGETPMPAFLPPASP
jgi:hypothetical protein